MDNLIFKNGDAMPIIGLGTWKSGKGDVKEAVIEAIKAGYRHIDCAPIYKNEDEVGEGITYCIESGIIERKDLWVTSKLWNDCHRKEHVKGCLEKTLEDLKLAYIDLYLIHWPVAFQHGVEFPESADEYLSLSEVPLTETWEAMQDLKSEGLAKHIGVSNFNEKKIQQLIDMGGDKPEMNQVELHPMLQQSTLLSFCKQNNVHMTAYSPLGSMDRSDSMKGENEPVPIENRVIKEIAEKHEASPAQILLAWEMARGVAVIPKSTNPERIKENLASAELALSGDEINRINALDENNRIIDGSLFVTDDNSYTLDSLWNE